MSVLGAAVIGSKPKTKSKPVGVGKTTGYALPVPKPIDIFSIYKAPFRADKYGVFIFDADSNMVADMDLFEKKFRIRGWGRIQYMENPEQIHDALASAFAVVTEGCEHDLNACVDALNRLWEAK